jgi:hypothetical protein
MTESTLASPVAGEDDKASLRLDDAQEAAVGHQERAEAAPAAPAANAMPPALDTVTAAELLAAQELHTTRAVAMPLPEAGAIIAAPSLDEPSPSPAAEAAGASAEETAAGALAAEHILAASDSEPSHQPTEAATPSHADADAPRSLTEAIDAAARLAAVEEVAIEVAAPAPAGVEPVADPLPADMGTAPDAPPAMPAPGPVAADGVPSLTRALDAAACLAPELARDTATLPAAAAASERPEPVRDGLPADPDGASPAADLASAPATAAEATAQPLTSALDAAAKLAADATAAAEALESLKRLLHRQHQGPATPAPPADGPAWAAAPPERTNPKPPPLPSPMLPASSDLDEDGQPDDEPQMPVPVPRNRAPERVRFDLRGFLAGFALSWAFGVVLYLFMTAG